MNIGDYVRFDGNIYIIKTIEVEESQQVHKVTSIYITNNTNGEVIQPYYYEFKSSPNIIDLIEVGDYVNGHIVTCIINNRITTDEQYYDYTWEMMNNIEISENSEIKEIMTREVYQNNIYKVERE